MEIKNKEVENYLSDLDNLIDTGHFKEDDITDYTFNHKELNLKDFVIKGREVIRSLFVDRKTDRLLMIQGYYSKIQLNKLDIDDVLDLMEKDMKYLKALK